MKGLQKRRRSLVTVIIAEGVLAILAIIGVVICCVQLQKIKTETQEIKEKHNADVQGFYAETELLHEKITGLEVARKLEKMDIDGKQEIPTPPITTICLKNVGDKTHLNMTTEIEEYATEMGEALADPYTFQKKEKEVMFSGRIDCLDDKIGVRIYFFKNLFFDSIKEGFENPKELTVSEGYFGKTVKELGIYLVELEYEGAEFYFAFQLK